MFLTVVLLILGLVLLIKGADWLVKGASSLARKHNISELIIGLTIVAFGTSAPELVVNTIASFENHPDIVFGNIIGSNNINLFLILGFAGLISPLVVQRSTVWKEIPFSLLAAIILLILANDQFIYPSSSNMVSRFDGFILLVLFILFLLYIFRQTQKDKKLPNPHQIIMKNWMVWGLIIFGLVALVIGGKLIVDSAVKIAKAIGISEKIISLTVVALGTSLPELATSAVAAYRKNNDIAVGNIIGSNIFNIFLILGVSAVIRPVPYDLSFNFDLSFLMIGTMVLFIAMFVGEQKKLNRWQAALLFCLYIGYTIILLRG